MKEIINRLHENRQIELAKSIMESAGYTVTKKVNESDKVDEATDSFFNRHKDKFYTIQSMLDNYGGKERFAEERDGTAELDIPCEMLGGNYDNVYMLCDQDEGGFEAVREFESRDDKEDTQEKHLPNSGGYNLLVSTSEGDYVYQNQWGMITLFKKDDTMNDSVDYTKGGNTAPNSSNHNRPLRTHQGTVSTSNDGANNSPATANNNRALKTRTGRVSGSQDYFDNGSNTTPNSSNHNRSLKNRMKNA